MPHRLSREQFACRSGQRFRVGSEEFELAGPLGDGAAGVVRRATTVKSKTARAVKFLAPDPKYIEEAAFDDVASRFKREGERGSGVVHDNLLRVFAYCENQDGSAFVEDGPTNPFLVMELVRGKTLESEIRRMPPDERGVFVANPRRLAIAIQIARALEYLHSRKIVHRDVKPANVMLHDGSDPHRPLTQLGDFGIVKWGDFLASMATGSLTATSQAGLGTLKYMSPEQALQPRDVAAPSDIYSFGVTLFELFTGQILASPHHVYAIMSARLERGNALTRFMSLKIRLGEDHSDLAELILDMHLRGESGRPTVRRVRAYLERHFEIVTGMRLPE